MEPWKNKQILLATIMFRFQTSFLEYSIVSLIIVWTLPNINMLHLKKNNQPENNTLYTFILLGL